MLGSHDLIFQGTEVDIIKRAFNVAVLITMYKEIITSALNTRVSRNELLEFTKKNSVFNSKLHFIYLT